MFDPVIDFILKQVGEEIRRASLSVPLSLAMVVHFGRLRAVTFLIAVPAMLRRCTMPCTWIGVYSLPPLRLVPGQ